MSLTHLFKIHYQIQKGYRGNIFRGLRFNKFHKTFHKFIYIDNISRPKDKQDKGFLPDMMTKKNKTKKPCDDRIKYIDSNPVTFIANIYRTYTFVIYTHTRLCAIHVTVYSIKTKGTVS